MKRGMQLQDLLPLVAGVYAFLSPIWTTTTDRATMTMVVLGIITALAAIAELVRPDAIPLEGLLVLLGVAFFVSPWVMGFSATAPMAWTAWIIGAVTFLVGAADVQLTRVHHRDTMAAQH
ncbi:SPW repeat protein [Intrasporangium calvum]|uniref:SPW repeat-containing integral membrane domain-containing protein n=2 Tax=Intrasporangium calvum TaxID=53358 RepID=E6S9X3_INTC7|nr:SPW repeat protein [Intrasporangium calvum]ADU47163.1 hypothetical protein Intca_0618 [Intrasporangium calvum DSM 43043]AXG12414.1 hypothetical protein DN585_02295 [Intrasporangium calvum]